MEAGQASKPDSQPYDLSLRLQMAKQRAAAAKSLSWALSLSAIRFFKVHAARLRRLVAEGGQISLLVTIALGEVSSFILAPQASASADDVCL
jgi:hypothetical protein